MRFVLAPFVFLSLAASLQAAYTPKQWAKELKAQTAAFKKADKDRNETISEAEFLQLLNPKAKTKEVTKRAGSFAQQFLQETANVFFDWFDEDASGDIDLEEWIVARTADPNGSTPGLFNIPEEVIDRNLNGTVTLKEFQWIVQAYVSPSLTKIWHQRVTAAIASSGYNDTTSGSNFSADQAGSNFGSITVVGLGTSGLTQTNSGTLTLGTNTYTGTTTVNVGSLGGTGSIAGTIDVTGTLTPGTSIGSTFGFELNSSSLNGGVLVESGTLNLAGGTQLDLSTLPFTGSQLTLINDAVTWNDGTFEVVTNGSTALLGSNTWELFNNGTTTLPIFIGGSFPISTGDANGTNTVILPSSGDALPVFQSTPAP